MGLNIKAIITKKELELTSLKNKKVAIDSFNILYQFLTTIRQADGGLLMNKQGEVTSHLNGLFFRTTKLMKYGIKPIFVFDGQPPQLKLEERKRRRALKEQARVKYEAAKEAKDMPQMKKFASRTAYLNKEMVAQAKELISLLGLPVVQAPSEGEAQVAHIVNRGDAYAAVSQDYDTLLYGCPRLIHNLSVAGRKKIPGKLAYKTVKPEVILLKDLLDSLNINQEQLMMLSILIGTDYNKGGVHGIGPKKALKLVQKYKGKYDELFTEVKFKEHCVVSWREVYNTFKNMPLTDDYDVTFSPPKIDKLKEFLIERFDFSKLRIENALKDLEKEKAKQEQKSLFGF